MITTTGNVPRPRTPADTRPAPIPSIVAERFRVHRVLHRGSTTATVTATDETTHAEVVLKTARSGTLARGTRLRLLHEAEVLRTLSGPGLVPLIDAGEHDGLFYLAMPLIPGMTLMQRLGQGRLSVDETLQLARDLFAALAAVHAHDVLHRDIKPSNVMVNGDVVAHATLIDFGLARSASLDESVRDEPVGTARYMSPEQAGLVHREVDERSDLYAVGVVLFECLTGRPPFTGETVGEVLRQHLSAPAPDVRSYGVPVPTVLAQIVQRLLRKDPRDRYQSAEGALADIDQLIRRLADGDPDPVVPLGLADRRATLTEPAFVGRRLELGRLSDAVRGAQTGHGGVVLVEAESGGGKSRLLEELAGRCVETDVLVLRGQGVDQAARRPFQLLEGVADGIVTAAVGDPVITERLTTALEADRGVLVSVLPVLADVLGVDDDDAESLGPEEFGESRALAALARFLDVLASRDRATVVILDDCQWADEATIRLLGKWQRDLNDRLTHVLIIGAFRSEEVRAGDPLRAVTQRRITLSPFIDADVRALVESMAGRIPDSALRVVIDLSAGSPFMASAVLRGLVESGALFHEGQQWRTDDSLLAGAQSSREAAAFLSRRLELLSADVLALVGAGAVLGKEFDVELAAGLVGADPARSLASLQALRSRHLLWLDADGLVATFVHDKLREALLDRMTIDQRRELHARAAAILAERPDDVSAYDLAFHFHAAGDDTAALPYALAAAAEARARHALSAAEQQYRIATHGIAVDDVDTAREVRTGLGDVLMLQGSYDEAAQCFTSAMAVATDPLDRAALELRLGELTFKRGEVLESVRHLETALRSLGRRVPKRGVTFLTWALWEALVQAAHCLLPRRMVQRRRLESGAVDILAARICSRLAYSYWFSRGRNPTAWAHFREMNILERYPPTLELAQAYSEHAPVMTTLPWYSRGIDYAQRSLDIRREFGDVWGQGQSLHFYGVVLYASGRFTEAIEKLTEAIRLLDRTGDQWEINTALWHIGFSYYRLGRLDDAIQTLLRCYSSGVEIGDHQAAAIGLSGLSKSSGGLVQAEDVQRELTHSVGDVHTSGELLTGEAIRLLAAGETQAAIDTLVDADRQVRRAGVRNEYVAPILPWLVTALRIQAEDCGPYRLGERRILLRRARRVARRGRRLARAYRNNLPHVLREQALLAQLVGRDARARRLLNRALRAAEAGHMRAEVDQTHEALDTVEKGLRPQGAIARGVARPAHHDVDSSSGPLPSLSLVDRFDTLLGAGRAIAAALTPAAVYDVVRTAADDLLRSEECVVVLVDTGDNAGLRFSPLDASSGFGVSERLVREAIDHRSVRVYTDDTDGDPSVSMVLHQTRSALAAPIFVRGRPVACWYVVHRQVSGLFGPDEVRLAEFVSTLAGAALENAEGFAEVQALSQSLERRVDERTAELSVANNALRSTLDELERANNELRRLDELKSDFVAMVSHELRSPLTSILGYCSTMLRHWDKVDEERKRSFVDIIERQSRRLSGLVNDLLEMSRIESGHLETTLQPLAVGPMLDELAREYSDRITDIAITGDVDAIVVADADHLHRVFINLLDNAIKYGAEPVTVDVQAHRDAVSIFIRDHGEGVPAEFRPRLFEKFAQASSGSTRKATGTGLGLSIVQGLVVAMAGTVDYEPPSVGDGGFVVRLPRAL